MASDLETRIREACEAVLHASMSLPLSESKGRIADIAQDCAVDVRELVRAEVVQPFPTRAPDEFVQFIAKHYIGMKLLSDAKYHAAVLWRAAVRASSEQSVTCSPTVHVAGDVSKNTKKVDTSVVWAWDLYNVDGRFDFTDSLATAREWEKTPGNIAYPLYRHPPTPARQQPVSKTYTFPGQTCEGSTPEKPYTIERTCGACPVQYGGVVHGHQWYFRARHEAWSLHVAESTTNELYAAVNGPVVLSGELADDLQFGAGYMPYETAESLIDWGLRLWIQNRAALTPAAPEGAK